MYGLLAADLGNIFMEVTNHSRGHVQSTLSGIIPTLGVFVSREQTWVRLIFSIQLNLASESFDSDSTHDSQWLSGIDSNQLTTLNGFLEFDSNRLTPQISFQNCDSDQLMTQKTFQNFDSNQLMTQKAS